MKNCILGGGLAGLSLAYFLDEPALILEKESVPGGLCRSFAKGPFTYDLGGHIVYSRDQEVLDLMLNFLGTNKRKIFRKNTVLFKGIYVKYPFENDLSSLPKDDVFYCLYNFLVNEYPAPKNFREWIYHMFGKGIAELYMVPYNEKIWKYPLEKMGLEWVERIPRPPVEDVIKSSIGISTEGYTHQLYFHYPITGGIQALTDSIRDALPGKIDVRLNRQVVSLRPCAGAWEIKTQTDTFLAERVISTLPLPELAKCMDIPAEVRQAINSLVYNRMYVVLLGISNPSLKDKTAAYVPEKGSIFHRIVFNGYFGDENTGKENSAITAEITFPPGSPLESMPESELLDQVINDMERLGITQREDIFLTDVKLVPYAYVVYDEHHSKNMKLIMDYFTGQKIFLCGRFAEFEYLNMDATIKHALDLAKRLKNGQA